MTKIDKLNAKIAKRNAKQKSKDMYRAACIEQGLTTPAEDAVSTLKAVGGLGLKGVVSTLHGIGHALQATSTATSIVVGGTATVLKGETTIQLVERKRKLDLADVLEG